MIVCAYMFGPSTRPDGREPGRFLTVQEAAQELRMSVSTVWRWIAAGRLTAYRFGPRKIRIRAQDLERVIRPANEADGASETRDRGTGGILTGPRTAPLPREEAQRRLAALARLEATAAELRARSGGEMVPSSTELVRQARRALDERDRRL
jgi:excisionase family DNA binding protein